MNQEHTIVGSWRLVEADENFDVEDGVEMDILNDGRLFYGVASNDKWQIMLMTYRIEGNEILTDQPSSPSPESTPFSFGSDGSLNLEFGGARTRFVRVPLVGFPSNYAIKGTSV